MDVPFSSSGALSRRHYGLVRVVESSVSIQEANKILRAEIQSLRIAMTRRDLSLAQCMEYLVILLYCFNTIEITISSDDIDFAFPHAIGLAEAGKTIEQKRIGYVFCSELMSPDHEMQLMLVNTLRKDLESPNVARICLALESLIATPTEHVIPAVQSRIQDLISHNSPRVRRRAIHACRLLSQHEQNLLLPAVPVLLRRLDDEDYCVINAALSAVSSPIFREAVVDSKQMSNIRGIIHNLAFNKDHGHHTSALKALSVLSLFGAAAEETVSHLHHCVQDSANKRNFAMLHAAFRLFSLYTAEQLKNNLDTSPVSCIRELLMSDDPNLHYLFLVCLNAIDARIWSGSTHVFPSVLDSQEVEKIMRMIESPDTLIRTKTLSVLMEVDQNIIDDIYARLLESLSPEANIKMRDECTVRLLEVVSIKATSDGETYARCVIDLLASSEGAFYASVSEIAVEKILSYLQYSNEMFQIQCAASLLATITEKGSQLGPTMLVVISALSAQYCTLVSIPPSEILSGISMRLPGMPASVNDACILAMLRLAAFCEVSNEDIDNISHIYSKAGRHIRKRCEQFQSLCQKKEILQDIVKRSRSSSLPDFLLSLESYVAETSNGSRLAVSSRSSRSSGIKLRYEAYDKPRLTPKLRESRDSRGKPSSKSAEAGGTGKESTDASLITMTDMMSRADLIAFDSPAKSTPDDRTTFSMIWNSMEASGFDMRGWSDVKVEDLIKNLQSSEMLRLEIIPAHEPSVSGEVKVKIVMDHDQAVIKLRASEEGGTLWRMRTEVAEALVRFVLSIITSSDVLNIVFQTSHSMTVAHCPTHQITNFLFGPLALPPLDADKPP
ncbi:hypothetical protein APHAL10511_000128 [Amanita phalloides]|nr:hypothetical protein APHAL10511_000128 [Amanita phalloides]